MQPAHQRGVFLVDALVALLIFSLGILGLVTLGGAAISAQSAAQYRTEAANLAGKIVAEIALDMERGKYAASLPSYAHLPATASGTTCTFGGSASAQPVVTAWVGEVVGQAGAPGLPGSTTTSQQIVVDPVDNKVTVTLCWRPPGGAAAQQAQMHRHSVVAYIH